jgi:heme-degrading monooxygenase HmoA
MGSVPVQAVAPACVVRWPELKCGMMASVLYSLCSYERRLMIARTWHGTVLRERARDYHAYLLGTGVPDLQTTPGNRGVYVLQRFEGLHAHFLMISLWDSLGAIRAFAGDDVERARYYPEDAAYLLELEPTVTHYEVLTSPPEQAI